MQQEEYSLLDLIKRGDLHTLLLEKIITKKPMLLHAATETGDMDVVRVILSHGADVNA